MKLLIDFFPVLLFYIAFKLFDIYVATIVAIITSIIQVSAYRLIKKRFETMHLVTLGIIILFGGATLLLHDELFIKWKPTIINWLFGFAFIISQFIGDRPLVQRMMSTVVSMPQTNWLRLNTAWGLFFILLGFINLYVIYNFDTDTWVNFKLFGMIGLTIAFVIIQSLYIARYIKDTDETPVIQDRKD